MRTRILTTLTLCGLAVAPLAEATASDWNAAIGQAIMDRSTDRNAALDYWRLVTVTPEVEASAAQVREVLAAMHPQAEAQALAEPEALLPGGSLGGTLEELDEFFVDLDRAAMGPRCDFQVRYEDGYAALLPHLEPLRRLGRLLVVDARRQALLGDTQRAAERLATALRLARHVSGDRILVSSLVSASIANSAIAEAHWLLDRSQDDVAAREVLQPALARYPVGDPFRAQEALRTERDLISSLARQFRGPHAGAEFADVFMQMTDEGEAAEARLVRALDGRGFKAEIERTVDLFDAVFEAWIDIDPQRSLAGIGERVASGDFGPVARIVVPAFGRTQLLDARARDRVEGLRQRVNDNG